VHNDCIIREADETLLSALKISPESTIVLLSHTSQPIGDYKRAKQAEQLNEEK
jgi:hypothetical protein